MQFKINETKLLFYSVLSSLIWREIFFFNLFFSVVLTLIFISFFSVSDTISYDFLPTMSLMLINWSLSPLLHYVFLLPILSHRFSISSNQIFFYSHLCESKTFFIRGMNTIISPTSLCPLTFPTHFCTVLFFPFLNLLSFYSFLPCSNSYCSILFYPILSFLFITTLFNPNSLRSSESCCREISCRWRWWRSW